MVFLGKKLCLSKQNVPHVGGTTKRGIRHPDVLCSYPFNYEESRPKANSVQRQIPSKSKFRPKAIFVQRQILYEGKCRTKKNAVQKQILFKIIFPQKLVEKK